MNRANYYNYIEERLNLLALRIEARGKLNILDLHLHSESFYQHFFNLLFNWNLSNLNAIKQNVAAIDLIDQKSKIIIQVSATATVQKVEGALTKNLAAYADYTFKFISIAKDAGELRTKSYKNPNNLVFSPATDIYDIASILKLIFQLEVDPLKRVFEFIRKELGTEIPPIKIETNLAAIINILAKQDWDSAAQDMETCPYDVERKIDINQLDDARSIIEDFKIHYGRLNRIYAEFNQQGSNKSTSVLAIVRRQYLDRKNASSDDALFFAVIDSVADMIQSSQNYQTLPYDELELCVSILVVDAFIRCKIFKHPAEARDAAS